MGELLALLLAAALGARLQARWSQAQALELHRVSREQDALLAFLDLLSELELAIRRSLPSPDQGVRWSEAVDGVGSPMIREHPGVTWDRSDGPDADSYQWGTVVGCLLDVEAEWRTHLSARVGRRDIGDAWDDVVNTGAPMGLKGSAATGGSLASLLNKVDSLMTLVRSGC